MNQIQITSRNNSQVKQLLADEIKNIFYVFEGEKLIYDILNRKVDIEILVVDSNYFLKNQSKIGKKNQCIKDLWLVSQPVLKKLSKLTTPAPLLAVIKSVNLQNFLPESYSTILVLDNIQDPVNCGGIFRSAVAFNLDCIVITGDSVNPANRKFLRGAQDSVFEIDFYSFKTLDEFLKVPGLSKFSIYSTTSKDSQKYLSPEKIKIPCMVIFGNEGKGLDDIWLNNMNIIKIPQNKKVNSLNLAVSASIICYEINKKIN